MICAGFVRFVCGGSIASQLLRNSIFEKVLIELSEVSWLDDDELGALYVDGAKLLANGFVCVSIKLCVEMIGKLLELEPESNGRGVILNDIVIYL